MEIKIVNRSKHPLPEYKTKASWLVWILGISGRIVTLNLWKEIDPNRFYLSNYPRDMKHKSVPVAGWL